MTDLFADAASTHASQTAPLPQRIRPRTLDELVGQRHVLAEGSALRLAIEADRTPSMILYGPPGVGKTTLARIVAETTGAAFEELSAVSARVDDVRGVLQRARDRLGANGTRTILFLDEIHRFNKGQQDALLPAVESGLVTLIGATTENPYFEVNSALLSRCQLFQLEPLTEEDVAAIVRRGEEALGVELAEDSREAAVHSAGGDARNALNILEGAVGAAGDGPVTPEHVRDAARKRPLLYDKGGDQHYDVISAFIKSMRGSDTDAAVYYLAVMLAGGEDPRFVARRMVVFASEDVGTPTRARSRWPSPPPGRRVRRHARVPDQPEPGGRLPGPSPEVERLLRRHRRRHARRARARQPAPAAASARRLLRRSQTARPRRRLRLSARPPRRGRRAAVPPGRAG